MADRRPPPLRSTPELSVQSPRWTVTRKQRTDVSPVRGPPGVASSAIDPEHYQQRTITSTERVHVVQVPLEVSTDNPETVYLSLSPTGNNSQHIESTTTTIEAGGVPIVGALTKDGIPIYNGIYYNPQQRQTTTIITTTTTTYMMLDDDSETSDDFDRVSEEEHTQQQITVDLPLLISGEATEASEDEFVIIDKQETPRNNDNVAYIKVSDSHPHLTGFEDQPERMMSSTDTYITSPPLSSDQSPPAELTSASNSTPGQISPKSPSSPTKEYEVVEQSQQFYDYPSSESGKASPEHSPDPAALTDSANVYDSGVFGNVKRPSPYPEPHRYDGPLASTSRASDAAGLPLFEHVNAYHPGTSYEYDHDDTTKNPKKSFESAPYYDYPTNVLYQGPVASTSRSSEIYGDPLSQYVSAYHPGYSESTHDSSREISEKEDFVDIYEDPDYQYIHQTEPIPSTSRHPEVAHCPLATHVATYHTGYSEDTNISQARKRSFPIITGFFKKGAAHQDYPVSEPFEGPVDTTGRTSEVDNTPLDTHVSVYHTGRSDEAPA
uniref:Chitin-binding type-2 domain-containing protein n=1 Tax=Panagrellus redivivus TaxID=6233 RepID=A0A7E4WCW8_PANRE